MHTQDFWYRTCLELKTILASTQRVQPLHCAILGKQVALASVTKHFKRLQPLGPQAREQLRRWGRIFATEVKDYSRQVKHLVIASIKASWLHWAESTGFHLVLSNSIVSASWAVQSSTWCFIALFRMAPLTMPHCLDSNVIPDASPFAGCLLSIEPATRLLGNCGLLAKCWVTGNR